MPTVVVVSVVILIGMLGLLTLWEQENLLFARSGRLRQARADAESAGGIRWRMCCMIRCPNRAYT